MWTLRRKISWIDYKTDFEEKCKTRPLSYLSLAQQIPMGTSIDVFFIAESSIDKVCSRFHWEFLVNPRVRLEKWKHLYCPFTFGPDTQTFPEHLKECHQIFLSYFIPTKGNWNWKASLFKFCYKEQNIFVHIFSDQLFWAGLKIEPVLATHTSHINNTV